jgi:hypothetical protein
MGIQVDKPGIHPRVVFEHSLDSRSEGITDTAIGAGKIEEHNLGALNCGGYISA